MKYERRRRESSMILAKPEFLNEPNPNDERHILEVIKSALWAKGVPTEQMYIDGKPQFNLVLRLESVPDTHSEGQNGT